MSITIDSSTITVNSGAVMGAPPGTAGLFFARAWVNFNGTGTVAIRASGGVSSITDGGTGVYTINFTTSMTDANYCITSGLGDTGAGSTRAGMFPYGSMVAGSFQCLTGDAPLTTLLDSSAVCVAAYR